MALDLLKLRATAQRVASSHGLDVVEVEFSGGGKHRALRVFLERDAAGRAKLAAEAQAAAAAADVPKDEDEESASALPVALLRGEVAAEHLSGITHEDCEHFSTDFGTLIDVEDLVPGGEYTLEVSSPGLDRKLESPADFARFRGSLVKAQTAEPVAGNRFWQGRLVAAGESTVTLDLTAVKQKKTKGRKGAAPAAPATVELDIGNIEKANLIPEI